MNNRISWSLSIGMWIGLALVILWAALTTGNHDEQQRHVTPSPAPQQSPRVITVHLEQA